MDAEQGRTRIGFSVGPTTVDAVLSDGTTVTLTGLTYMADASGNRFAAGVNTGTNVIFANLLSGGGYLYLRENGTFSNIGGPPLAARVTTIINSDSVTQPAVIAWLEAQGQPVAVP